MRGVAQEVENALNADESRDPADPPVRGLRDLVDTDWVPSCASDCGEVDQADWDKRKMLYMGRYGGKRTGGAWELRPRSWWSPQVSRDAYH